LVRPPHEPIVAEWNRIHKKKDRAFADPAQIVRFKKVPGGGIEPPTRGFSVPIRESGGFPPFSITYISSS